MMHIHHARHTIEPEPIESILLHVEAQVAQQESKHFVTAIVEKSTIPKLMTTLSTFVEVEMISSVEFIQTIEDVLARVRVNNVEKNG